MACFGGSTGDNTDLRVRIRSRYQSSRRYADSWRTLRMRDGVIRREGNKWTGGKEGEDGGFTLRYKEERRKVGGRSLPYFKGTRRLGIIEPAHWQAQSENERVARASVVAQ